MGRSRIGPEDFEAALYPVVQREAAKKTAANCWEVGIGAEDAQLLDVVTAARFAYDALEHYALEQPELGRTFAGEALVVVSVDESLPSGKVSCQAVCADEADRASRKARAFVLGAGVFDGREAPRKEFRRIITDAVDARLYEEKGSFMGIASLVKALQRKTEGVSPDQAQRRLSPVSLIQHTIDELETNAMTWPDGKDFPPRVVVYVSQADYAYYGPNRQANERRLEDEILLYAQECGASLERDPRVSIKVDPLLYCGQMRVESSFDEGGGRPAPAGFPSRSDAPTRGAAPARAEASARSACVTPAMAPRPDDALRTPEYDPRRHGNANAMAKLTSPFFQSAVLPDDTVGRVRYGDGRKPPTIKLEGPEFEFVSHEQGFFACDCDGWSFTSLGRNGTSVQRKGAWLQLDQGKPFPLEDGDGISFGKCAPLTFSVVQ